jgi:hypothetical protein
MAFGGPIGGKARATELHVPTAIRATINFAVLFSMSHAPFKSILNPKMQYLLASRSYLSHIDCIGRKLSLFLRFAA